MRGKYTAKWGVQIAGMIFQTHSRFTIGSSLRKRSTENESLTARYNRQQERCRPDKIQHSRLPEKMQALFLLFRNTFVFFVSFYPLALWYTNNLYNTPCFMFLYHKLQGYTFKLASNYTFYNIADTNIFLSVIIRETSPLPKCLF